MSYARLLAAVLWGLAWAAAGRAEAGGAVDPVRTLDEALTKPVGSFAGHLTVTRWFGRKTRAEEIRAFWDGPDRYRWEFLAPDGSVERTLVSDGVREELRLGRKGHVIAGDAGKSAWRLMSRERERELLLVNYQASLAGRETVLGRPAWLIELTPKTRGKPRQRLSIDCATRHILESRRFLPQGGLATFSRFTRYEPREDLPDDLFQVGPSTPGARAHELEPDFLTLEAAGKAMGTGYRIPKTLPGGFEFESGDRLELHGRTVWHLRYTDGLVSLSLFETDRPVSLGAGDAPSLSASADPASPWVSSSGKVLHWRAGTRYNTLIAEVSGELLAEIAAKLGKPSN